jgi:hypothetical protein
VAGNHNPTLYSNVTVLHYRVKIVRSGQQDRNGSAHGVRDGGMMAVSCEPLCSCGPRKSEVRITSSGTASASYLLFSAPLLRFAAPFVL